MKSARVLYSLFFLCAFGTFGCVPFQATRSQHTNFGSHSFIPQSFNQVSNELGGGTNGLTDGTGTSGFHAMTLNTVVQNQCIIGELNILLAAFNCPGHSAPLLVTALDAAGEHVLLNIPPTQDRSALIAKLETPITFTAQGNSVNLFVCLDHNLNGKCSDEPIMDLNQLSADVATETSAQVCSELANGSLIYHKFIDFLGSPPTAVATTIQTSLNNAADGGATTGNGDNTVSILLYSSEPNTCPVPTRRTNGCFASGTKINLTAKNVLPVEKLVAGMSVLLGDGRMAKIQSVVAGPEQAPMIQIQTVENQTLLVTQGHPIVTKSGIKAARDVSMSDEVLLGGDRRAVGIRSIALQKTSKNVYNFELVGGESEADHVVIANGLLSGELVLQKRILKFSEPLNLKTSAR